MAGTESAVDDSPGLGRLFAPYEGQAYFFDYEIPGALDDSAYDDTRDALIKWNKAWQGGQRPH